jgi:hypothetical protein
MFVEIGLPVGAISTTNGGTVVENRVSNFWTAKLLMHPKGFLK